MEFLMDPSIWIGLLTLVVLEIVLGIDNLVFIAILADKLPLLRRLPGEILANPSDFRIEGGNRDLLELDRTEVPFSSDLHRVLGEYSALTRRYRGDYPEVTLKEQEIADLLRRMYVATNGELKRLRTQLSVFEGRRANLIGQLKQASVLEQRNREEFTTYENRRQQYEGMRQKLEQARLALEVGERGAGQFIILDPALVPMFPTKPNRFMVLAISFGIGIVLGFLLTIGAELLDTTVRRPKDVEGYGKPIVAYLPQAEARAHRKILP